MVSPRIVPYVTQVLYITEDSNIFKLLYQEIFYEELTRILDVRRVISILAGDTIINS